LVEPQKTVAQIVLEHPQCARIFFEHGIDFCCRGAVALSDACAALGPEAGNVVDELDRAIAARPDLPPEQDPRKLSDLQLVAHIVDRHHLYLRKALAFLEPLASKVVAAHVDRQPSLSEVQLALVDLRSFVDKHLDREESTVFPLLLGPRRASQRLHRELAWMQADHLRVGDTLRRLRTLTDGFVPPPWACTSYRTLMAELERMERDTFEHVHLENNVLAPRFL
jgi:regulator of cell morphogenesis and NO signaling